MQFVVLRWGRRHAADYLKDSDIAIQAPSALLMEKETGTVIYEKNAHERRFPAERHQGYDHAADSRGY
ncbi:MAG: hypothetical protein V8T45_10090 [Oscillospiraceae bacterium]